MAKKEYKPRLAIELEWEEYAAINKMLPYGFRRAVFSALVNEVIRVVSKGGMPALNGICSGAIQLTVKDPNDGSE